MSFMLTTVVWSVIILIVVIGFQSMTGIANNGVKWGLGPRNTSKDHTLIQSRAVRTVQNHIESMLIYVPLALVAHMAGVSGDLVVKGGWLYIIGRAIYPLTYWMGLNYVRTLIWAVSLVGIIMVLVAILSGAK